jgi:hypothetical protein
MAAISARFFRQRRAPCCDVDLYRFVLLVSTGSLVSRGQFLLLTRLAWCGVMLLGFRCFYALMFKMVVCKLHSTTRRGALILLCNLGHLLVDLDDGL